MSKKSNPTLIGAFVVGAVILLAVFATVFGGSELLEKRQTYVAYFVENTKGLRIGSNITMNGVIIGEVTQIALLIDQDDYSSKTEVTLEVSPERWQMLDEGEIVPGRFIGDAMHDELINVAGVRATIALESIVTGRLLVDIAFRPEVTPVLRGGDEPPHPEIPTIPSSTQQLVEEVQTWLAELSQEFDAEEFAGHLQSAARGADELLNSQDVRETLAGINALTNRPETQNLSATLQSTLREVERAAANADAMLSNANAKLETDLPPIMETLHAALSEAERAMAGAAVQLQGDTPQTYQLGETLREIEGAARALRELLEKLERNPWLVPDGGQ